MREPHDALPTPAGWNRPTSRFRINWPRDRPTSDTTAVRLAERDGEPVTLVRFSVEARLTVAVGTVVIGGFGIWLIGEDLVDRTAPLAIALSLGMLALMTILMIRGILMIARPSELGLSTSGVRLRSGPSWTYLPWSAARGVEAELAHYDGEPRWFITIACDSPGNLRTGRLSWPFRRRDGLRIDAGIIAINRVLLYHLLRYYYTHPQARAELGSPASLDRIRRRDFFR